MTDKPVKLCEEHSQVDIGNDKYCLKCGTIEKKNSRIVHRPTKMLAIAEVFKRYGDDNPNLHVESDFLEEIKQIYEE